MERDRIFDFKCGEKLVENPINMSRFNNVLTQFMVLSPNNASFRSRIMERQNVSMKEGTVLQWDCFTTVVKEPKVSKVLVLGLFKEKKKKFI